MIVGFYIAMILLKFMTTPVMGTVMRMYMLMIVGFYTAMILLKFMTTPVMGTVMGMYVLKIKAAFMLLLG